MSFDLKINKHYKHVFKCDTFVHFRWFPEVQNIFYQGNKRKQVPSNHDQAKLESFFNCAAALMTEEVQQLALNSISDYTDLLVQPPVRAAYSKVLTLPLWLNP